MTEKEKMLHGEWHDANFDKNLLEERRKAELLCYDFNMARHREVSCHLHRTYGTAVFETAHPKPTQFR